jgi:NADPH-dependent glutamate synthase beta subunit-like oxidoreductase
MGLFGPSEAGASSRVDLAFKSPPLGWVVETTMQAARMRYQRVAVPEEPPSQRVGGFDEVLQGYPAAVAIREANRCLQCALPFCVEACPIGQDCRGYVGLVAAGRFDDAARLVLQANPMATTLCKVCYHFCEDACIMGGRGTPIAIRQLKRAAMELGNSDLAYVPQPPRTERVAIVGAGPAGIMAAWELGLRGYGVTIFEMAPIVGGQAAAIPRYRMPGNEIAEDLERFRRLDITWEMGKRAGVDFTPEELLAEGFSAVFLALGASLASTPGVPGEELAGVIKALDFLLEANQGRAARLGQRIIVIGGGDVAIDSVRSARRISPGAKVTMAYRRTREEAPAGEEELREAEPEDIEFRWLLSPVRIIGSGRVEAVEFQRMRLSAPDKSGRRSVEPIPGAFETIPCDTVVLAIGQKADLTGLPEALGLRIASKGWPEGGRPDGMTAVEGIFASGGRSVVHAMAAGTRAAESIDAYLRKKAGAPPLPRPDPFGGPTPPPPHPTGYTEPLWRPKGRRTTRPPSGAALLSSDGVRPAPDTLRPGVGFSCVQYPMCLQDGR